MKIVTKVQFTVECTLTENELRALDALAGYGFKSFIGSFYKLLGIHYMRPFESDLKALFEKVESLRPQLHAIDEARKKLQGDKEGKI